MKEFLVYVSVLAMMSLVTFCLYVSDKNRAKKGAYRISEKVLLSVSFFGGAIGGICAMKLVRHKTKHWYFTAVNVLGLVWQVALAVYIFMTRVVML